MPQADFQRLYALERISRFVLRLSLSAASAIMKHCRAKPLISFTA